MANVIIAIALWCQNNYKFHHGAGDCQVKKLNCIKKSAVFGKVRSKYWVKDRVLLRCLEGKGSKSGKS